METFHCIVRPGTVSLRSSLSFSSRTRTFNKRAKQVAGGWQTKSAVTSSPCAWGAISASDSLARASEWVSKSSDRSRKMWEEGNRERSMCARRKDKRRKEEVEYVSWPKVECWPRVISVATTRAAVNFYVFRFQSRYTLYKIEYLLCEKSNVSKKIYRKNIAKI